MTAGLATVEASSVCFSAVRAQATPPIFLDILLLVLLRRPCLVRTAQHQPQFQPRLGLDQKEHNQITYTGRWVEDEFTKVYNGLQCGGLAFVIFSTITKAVSQLVPGRPDPGHCLDDAVVDQPLREQEHRVGVGRRRRCGCRRECGRGSESGTGRAFFSHIYDKLLSGHLGSGLVPTRAGAPGAMHVIVATSAIIIDAIKAMSTWSVDNFCLRGL
mmetsp:Transcript_11434/g.18633  ORF Transcript_11434/g.18633 Transcript_11434/m.18633 type:complete len:215 (-) Transcript_11434:632-1276(-)